MIVGRKFDSSGVGHNDILFIDGDIVLQDTLLGDEIMGDVPDEMLDSLLPVDEAMAFQQMNNLIENDVNCIGFILTTEGVVIILDEENFMLITPNSTPQHYTYQKYAK